MRISDWSSDVCSSDLQIGDERVDPLLELGLGRVVDGHQPDGLFGRHHRHRLGRGQLQILFGRFGRQRAETVNGPKRSRLVRNGHRRSAARSEEHTSELQTLMRISYAVFCLKNKKKSTKNLTSH